MRKNEVFPNFNVVESNTGNVSYIFTSESVEKAEKCYQNALDVAVAELPPTNIVRLGLALNFSVFYYEIMNNPDKACNLAKTV